MDWAEAVNAVSPYIVRIDTPGGHGTGYLCAFSSNRQLCGIATALHVVAAADEWQQPIRVHNHNFTKTRFLRENDRFIFTEHRNDSAVIVCPVRDLDLPQPLIQLRPVSTPLSIGAEVGWLGFPGLSSYTLCFFSGNISAMRRLGYFIDGVAINGVSGGPVVYVDGTNGVQFVGIVSAYHANRLTGDTLPGLLVAQDVSHFHSVVQEMESLDQGESKQQEIDAQSEAAAQPEGSPAAEIAPGAEST